MTLVHLPKGIDSTLLIIHNRLKSTGNYRGITVIKEYGDLPQVECYGGLINQVFMNLLCNAIDALEECHYKRCVNRCFEDPSIASKHEAREAFAQHGASAAKLARTPTAAQKASSCHADSLTRSLTPMENPKGREAPLVDF